MWERRVKQLPDRLVLPCWLAGLKSSLGNNEETGQAARGLEGLAALGHEGCP